MKDLHYPQGATEDTSAKVSAARDPFARRLQEAQAPSGHDQWLRDTLIHIIQTGGPPPPKDKFQLLLEEYHRTRVEMRQACVIIENYDRELKRRTGELSRDIGHLQHECQRSKNFINSLQNELSNIRLQLEDGKTLSKVREKRLSGAQLEVDTLSISEVGEKVTALNEEIFQAAAALGEALVHKRYELSQTELSAAAAVSQEMVGEKMTNLLRTVTETRTRSQPPASPNCPSNFYGQFLRFQNTILVSC